ncbi:MAG: hypothetical protein OHK0038_14630 [Flammeovirgaceae bacterium]
MKFNNWNNGQIVLKTGEKVTGLLQFDWMTDIVLCKREGTVKAYSPQNVHYFEFFSDNKAKNRTFISYRNFKKSRNGYTFYEVIEKEGEQVVLRKSYRTSNPERILRGGMGKPKYIWKNEDWAISESDLLENNHNN